MVSLFKQDKIGTFEYFYFFIMVIYMSQMTTTTARMIGGLSSPYFPFLFPIILTLILLNRHWVKFDDKRLIRTLLLMALWTILIFTHKSVFNSTQFSFHFFLFYSTIIAFIHVQVFGKKMLILYENIMMKLCFISLILWGISVIYPGSASFFQSFPKGGYGTNVLYLFSWTDPSRTVTSISNGIARNSGCSWEPGRFSILIVLALYCNLIRNGIKFKGNWSGIIMLAALASTQSTTGYIAAIVLYSFFAIKKFDLQYIIAFFIFIVPIGYQLSKLDFMREKIISQMDMTVEIRKANEMIDYTNKVKLSNEYESAFGRFQSIYFQLINIEHDPLLGYGMNNGNSYFSLKISPNYALTGGLLRIIAMYGIPFGLLLYFFLYKSSAALGREFKVRKGALFAIIILSSFSYDIFLVPVFMAFWFYGLFRKEEDLLIPVSESEDKETEGLPSEAKQLDNIK